MALQAIDDSRVALPLPQCNIIYANLLNVRAIHNPNFAKDALDSVMAHIHPDHSERFAGAKAAEKHRHSDNEHVERASPAWEALVFMLV
jgi:hypothetical protein